MNERPERYFPEIIDERSSYLNLSPLTAIIQDLRRKNVVTAAAASGPHMSLLDSSDPWGSSESFGVDDQLGSNTLYGSYCICSAKSPQRRRTSLTGLRYGARQTSLSYSSSPGRDGGENSELKNGASDSVTCSVCGKLKRNEEFNADAWARSPWHMRLSSWLDGARMERLNSPRHAEALLQSTPHLRIICPASTDMNGSGTSTSRNLFSFVLPTPSQNQTTSQENSGSARLNTSDYRASLVRDRANQQAATELSSLLWILAHEMSLEDYGTVESEVFTSVFALVHSQENERRMAGLAALDALIDAPSADEEKKAIKFANTLSNGLRSAHGDYEFLSAVSKALGHMATRTANVDFVESEVTRALEWLRTDRSDRRYVFRYLFLGYSYFKTLIPLMLLVREKTGSNFGIERICRPCAHRILFQNKSIDTWPRRLKRILGLHLSSRS